MLRIFLLLAIFAGISGGLSAGEIILSDAKASGVQMTSETVNGDELTLHINCAIDKLMHHDVDTVKGPFTVLYLPKFHCGGAYGHPELPVYNKLVQLPIGADYRVEVKNYELKTYKLAEFGIENKIFPRQPSAPKNGEKVAFYYEPSAYFHKGFGGQELATLQEVGTLRHMRLARLTINPVRYDPIRNEIAVFNNMEVKVVLSQTNIERSRAHHEKYWAPSFAALENQVLTPKAIRFAERTGAETYLIISDPAFKDALKPFIQWKAEKGFKVKVEYTDSFGTEDADELAKKVREYVHNLYRSPTADFPAPSYLLLVGDKEQVPTFSGTSGAHVTDLNFVTVTKGDFLPDILMGRFSAQTVDQLTPQIEKTLEYEKYAFPDPAFLKDVVLVAGWDGSWARSHGWPHINYAKKYYINKGAFNTISTYLSAGSHQSESSIVADVSRGAAYVNYTAHGSPTSWADPKFTISNINSLENKGKYPFVIGNCCVTNRFEYATCFGEAWLRAKDKGAIGYVGGSNNTYWDEDFWWGVGLHSIVKPNNAGTPPDREDTGPGVFEAMFTGSGVTNAGFVVAGNLAVEESSSSRKVYYWEVYHLMGDPSLRTYMGKGLPLKASFSQEVSRENSTLHVIAPAGSYVGISQNGQLLGAGYVGSQCSADVKLSGAEAGEAKVVITGAGRIPFTGTVALK